MMYPFMQLNDNTEIVHSEVLEDNSVKVYIEKPIKGGFKSAACYLPEYRWEDVVGFVDEEIAEYREFIESTAHLIIKFAREGGFDNATNF